MAALPFLVLFLAVFSAHADPIRVGGCDLPIEASPAEDLAFEPGVDEQGWILYPPEVYQNEAGLDEGMFEKVTIDLDIPASNYSNNRFLQEQFPFAAIEVGDVEVEQSGKIRLNGTDLSSGGSVSTHSDDCP